MRRNRRRIWAGGTWLLVVLAVTFWAHASEAVELVLFQPEAFFRNTGAPGPVLRTFTVPSTQGALVLELQNGSPEGGDLVSSAVVKVNGLTMVKGSELSQQVRRLEVPLGNLVKGPNTLSVEVRSIPSSYVTVSVLGTYLLDVVVTSPVEGSEVAGDRADVEGTWEAYTPDVGITVNGVPAAIVGPTFGASGVRLEPGANTLETVITTAEGITDQHAVPVTATGETPSLEFWANLSSGVAPLRVTFLPRTRGIDVVEYRYDFQGDGVVDLAAATDEGVSFTYETPGTYGPTLITVLGDGTSLQAPALVLVEDRLAVDALLSTRWETVSSALEAQSIETALLHFLPESQERYRRLFTALSDQLPAIYASLPEPELVKVEGPLAQYRIRRTQLWEGKSRVLTYYVWYARDAQGLWKVQAY